MLAGIGCALVHRLAEVGAVFKDFVERGFADRAVALYPPRSSGPCLRPTALGFQLPAQQTSRTDGDKAVKDKTDQLGLGFVDHQLPIFDVVAEGRVAAHPNALL